MKNINLLKSTDFWVAVVFFIAGMIVIAFSNSFGAHGRLIGMGLMGAGIGSLVRAIVIALKRAEDRIKRIEEEIEVLKKK